MLVLTILYLKDNLTMTDQIKQSEEIYSALKIANFLVSFIWLTAILFYYLKYKDIKLKWVRSGIAITLLLFLITGAYCAFATYNLWKTDPVSRYLLPPYQEMSYFYKYSFFHFGLLNTITIAISLGWASFLFVLNKYSKERFLDRKEIWLGFFTALIAGWPGFIVYLILSCAILLAIQLVNVFILRNENKVIISYTVILSSLAVLFFGEFLAGKLDLNVLGI